MTTITAQIDLVGPEGYVHGWICVRPPCGKVGGEVFHPTYGKGKVVRDGVASFEKGGERQLGMRRKVRGEKIRPGTGGQRPSAFTHPSTGAPMNRSEVGDTFEDLFRTKGAHLLTDKYGGPFRPVAHARADGRLTARNTALDFMLDKKFGGELKTLNIEAKNQKTAISAEEVARKLAAAQEAGVKALLIVQVVDMATGEVKVYAYPGYVSKRVSMMEYLGEYRFTQAEFRRAQQRTGHWRKRGARAESYANYEPP
jgi:hypothetical protein